MPMSQTPSRPYSGDPYLGFCFVVKIRNREAGGMAEVSGLDIESDVETFREGGENAFERQLTGGAKFPTRIVMKRGIGDETELWDWYRDVQLGRIERKDLTIVLRDAEGRPHWEWTFEAACPIKWSGPQLRADQAAVAFESIELIHRGMRQGRNERRN